LTGGQIASLLIIKEFQNMGIPSEYLHSLYGWLPTVMPYAFELVLLGFETFLITDLKGNHGIYADSDISDFLFLGAESISSPNIVICLNAIINRIFEANGFEKSEIKFHICHYYHELKTD
jgi:hypothetical protein